MRHLGNSSLRPYAQKLRREMTKEERHLWYDFLKTLPVTFNRQKVIGKYIADFFCASANLVIELDGSQHYDAQGIETDKARDRYFAEHGFRILRYSNTDVNRNFAGVCEDILKYL
ncbi:MAG: endonuclease domain-containing protein [Oscillospiraceae bacterium]|nr:endonuclease domain-containing protein [Oscillospiraceae bacterium]